MDSRWGEKGRVLLRVALALLLLMAGARPLQAEEMSDEATVRAAAHHDRGLTLFGARDFEGAAGQFEAAEALAPSPANLYNLARCYEELGRLDEAMAVVDRYLALDLPPDRTERARALRERLAATPARIEVVTTPAGATVLVDGRPAEGVTPLVLDVAPGRRMVEAQLRGYLPARQEVAVSAGGVERVDLDLDSGGGPPVGPPPEAFDEPRRFLPHVALHVLGGGSFSLAMEHVSHSAVAGGDIGGGLDFGTLRLDFSVQAYALPTGTHGFVEISGAGRLAIRVGELPLWIEGELAIGCALMEITEPRADETAGFFVGLSIAPSLLISYQVFSWFEIVARPARLEILGLVGNLPDAHGFRFGMDLGLRFRYRWPDRRRPARPVAPTPTQPQIEQRPQEG